MGRRGVRELEVEIGELQVLSMVDFSKIFVVDENSFSSIELSAEKIKNTTS